jgi:nucleotide-binding universal stress UspA family protein
VALRTIVALLDGSPSDKSVLRQAQLLLARPGRLVLVEAVPGGTFLDGADERECAAAAAHYLSKVASQQRLTADIVTSVFRGDPAGAMVEEAFLCKADMLVMALAAQHGLSGSVVEHVLARSPIPAFLVRADTDTILHKLDTRDQRGVLVALDGSAFAEAALPVAAELATQIGSDITLLQIVPLAGSLPPPGAAAWDVRAIDALQSEAWLYLREVAGRFAREHRLDSPRIAVRIGQPAAAIAETIRDSSIRLAVMATHVHARWRRLLLGTVTDQVLRETTAPLVLVRPQALQVAPAEVMPSAAAHAAPSIGAVG